MNIYIMRHGEASFHARSDMERELTTQGKQQIRRAATWLKQHAISFDYGLVSPYIRAQQTLAAIQDIVPIFCVETTPELRPNGSVTLISDYLSTLYNNKKIQSILLVSHLPFIGDLINHLCPAILPPPFSTAAIALVTLSNAGAGNYQWMQTVS